jgi:hypothetical protein
LISGSAWKSRCTLLIVDRSQGAGPRKRAAPVSL